MQTNNDGSSGLGLEDSLRNMILRNTEPVSNHQVPQQTTQVPRAPQSHPAKGVPVQAHQQGPQQVPLDHCNVGGAGQGRSYNAVPPPQVFAQTPQPDRYHSPQQNFNQPRRGNNYRGRGNSQMSPRNGSNQQQQRQQQQPNPLGMPTRNRGGYHPAHLYTHAFTDPNTMQRAEPPRNRQIYDPRDSRPRQYGPNLFFERQAQYLNDLASQEVPRVGMSPAELEEKEQFRAVLAQVCHEVCAADPENLPSVTLETFGSVRSGFANANSDMDLVIAVKDQAPSPACFSLHERGLPRSLEKRLLQLGYGARLLSRTRVPIIKICQKPGPELHFRLFDAREKWDLLDHDLKYPHLEQNDNDHEERSTTDQPEPKDALADRAAPSTEHQLSELKTAPAATEQPETQSDPPEKTKETPSTPSRQKEWTRERKAGPLDFPKDGVGIQCDINFFNPLGLHNTHLLRCYALCDARVRPMVLFVKLWAKRRMINSSYSGTLSSYGYVLMVLHYLVNVAQPPVLPNLQHPWRPSADCTPPAGPAAPQIDGWTIDFWRDEAQIIAAAAASRLTANRDSVGALLVGFYRYYAALNTGGPGPRCFHWTRMVLALRAPHGTLTKEEKGWVKAATEEADGGRKIQHRYLFAIEDPFELAHNVARTVTHNGIVAIRDEFRRAHRLLQAIGQGDADVEPLLAQLTPEEEEAAAAAAALDKRPPRKDAAGQDRKGGGAAGAGRGNVPADTQGARQPMQQQQKPQNQPDFGSAELFPALPKNATQQKGRSGGGDEQRRSK